MKLRAQRLRPIQLEVHIGGNASDLDAQRQWLGIGGRRRRAHQRRQVQASIAQAATVDVASGNIDGA